jgi:hypothetical protein
VNTGKDTVRKPEPLLRGITPRTGPEIERFFGDGAQEGTRTLTPFGIRPSSVRVYQFHHLSEREKIKFEPSPNANKKNNTGAFFSADIRR